MKSFTSFITEQEEPGKKGKKVSVGKSTVTINPDKDSLKEGGDWWHPDPEQDKKMPGRGPKLRAREDSTSKPDSTNDRKLRPGESYMDFAKRHGYKSRSEEVDFSSVLDELTDEDLLFLSDDLIEEVVEEFFYETLEEGFEIDELESLLIEQVESELTYLEEATVTVGHDSDVKVAPSRSDRLAKIKSAVHKVASGAKKVAKKVAHAAGEVAGSAVAGYKKASAAAKDAPSATKSDSNDSKSDSPNTGTRSSSSSSGGSSSSSARGTKRPGLLGRIGNALKSGLKKAIHGAGKAVGKAVKHAKAGYDEGRGKTSSAPAPAAAKPAAKKPAAKPMAKKKSNLDNLLNQIRNEAKVYDPMKDDDFDPREAEKNRGVSGKNNPKGGKTLKKVKESHVPGKPAERLGAVTAIPQKERDAARERTLAKAKEMREKNKKKIQEKIDVGADAGATISDFVHSKDSRFSGDSKKQRIRRALGAYYAAKKEEFEIDEAVRGQDSEMRRLASSERRSEKETENKFRRTSGIGATKSGPKLSTVKHSDTTGNDYANYQQKSIAAADRHSKKLKIIPGMSHEQFEYDLEEGKQSFPFKRVENQMDKARQGSVYAKQGNPPAPNPSDAEKRNTTRYTDMFRASEKAKREKQNAAKASRSSTFYRDTHPASPPKMKKANEEFEINEAEGSYGRTPKATAAYGALANKRRAKPASEYPQRGAKKTAVTSAERHATRSQRTAADHSGRKSTKPAWHSYQRSNMTQSDRDHLRGQSEYGHVGYDPDGDGGPSGPGSKPKGKKLERQQKTGVSAKNESLSFSDFIAELNRYEKETGKDYKTGKKVTKGGTLGGNDTNSKVMRHMHKVMGAGRMGAGGAIQPRGVKKQKGAPTPGPTNTPAQKVAKRRANAQAARDLMHSPRD